MTERKNAGKSYSAKNLAEVTKSLNDRNSAKEAAKTQILIKDQVAGDGGGGCFLLKAHFNYNV